MDAPPPNGKSKKYKGAPWAPPCHLVFRIPIPRRPPRRYSSILLPV